MTRGLWVEFTWLGFFLEEEGWMESDRDACEIIYLSEAKDVTYS